MNVAMIMLHLLVYSLLLSVAVSNLKNSEAGPKSFRGIALQKLGRQCSVLGFVSSLVLSAPVRLDARQGAFEQDVDLYFKNLINGNRGKDKAAYRTPLPSPRKLDASFAKKAIDAIDRRICELYPSSPSDIQSFVNDNLPIYLSKFKQYAPIVSESLSDQYYFDLISFMHYAYARNVIPDSSSRVLLRERVADDILLLLNLNLPSNSQRFTALSIGIKQILDGISTVGLIESYTVDLEDLMDGDYLQETLSKGYSVNFQMTLSKPAWILGWLEFAGTDTMFHEEFGGSIVRQWLKNLGFKAKFEDYPLDNFYRTDIVQAQDSIVEMIISL